MRGSSIVAGLCMSFLLLARWVPAVSPQATSGPSSAQGVGLERAAVTEFIREHCTSCHNRGSKKGGLALDAIAAEAVEAHAGVWEKVVRKLSARQMPPAGKARPDERSYHLVVATLETELDRLAAVRPDPGRTPTLRRLNRTEYRNAVRDLLGLQVDAAALLPADEANHGFDSAPLGELSPTLLDRYLTAAQKISRVAVGRAPTYPSSDTFRVPPDRTQEEHVPGLPLGTRGGLLTPYTAPQDGEFDIQVWLTRDRNEHVEGLREPHELEVLLDRKRVASFTLKPPGKGEGHEKLDAGLKARVSVTAGPHDLGVTFLREPPPPVRDSASALRGALEPAPAPAPLTRGLPGFGHGSVPPERPRHDPQPAAHFHQRAQRAGG